MPDGAVGHERVQLPGRRLAAPVVADLEDHPGRIGGRHGRDGIGDAQRERLLDEDVLARRRGRFDVRTVGPVGRRQQDAVDRGIGEHLLVGGGGRGAVALRERLARPR